MAFKPANTAFLRLSTGSHGEEPSIVFDSRKNLWEVNLRPTGPGVGPIFFFSPEFMAKLFAKYQEHQTNGEAK